MTTQLALSNGSNINCATTDLVVRRGIDQPPTDTGFSERLPRAAELMAQPLPWRAIAIYESGVHPNTTELRAAFESCLDVPGFGWMFSVALESGLTPNRRYYRGEGIYDHLVWPDGFPTELKPTRRPTKRRPPVARPHAQPASCDFCLFKILVPDRCICAEARASVEAQILQVEHERAGAAEDFGAAMALATHVTPTRGGEFDVLEETGSAIPENAPQARIEDHPRVQPTERSANEE